jgi:DNA-binding CsgD family transcriptional regulator/tetratricopeptide (TPR) repeat protein
VSAEGETRAVTQAGPSGVLEREHEIAELADAAREAAEGAGSVVLAFGEAGIGKSSLVAAVRGVLPPHGRLLVGYCDDLATPRTLGPFRDLVGSVGSELATALRQDSDRVLDALRAELSWTGHPTVLAVEDVHWADEATVDALSYLIRRVAELPAVLLLTYRDDDLGPAHPLHRVLGLAARASRLRRLALARLSEAAVWRLAAPTRLDPHELYSVTGGNPFFVTEVLASANIDTVPQTVVDAVLARVRRLDPDTQAALEQLAVVPSTVDQWLLDALVPGGIAALVAAEQRDLLDVSPNRVGFHHELIRRAIADALPVARRVQLNRRVLAALVDRDGSDPSRVMHHAVQAGDQDAIIRYGPRAAHDATRAGANREAAAHLRLVLQHKERFDPRERADLLGRYAIACYTNGDMPSAAVTQQEAVELRRTLGDPRTLGAELEWLSRMCWTTGEPDRAECSADEAIAVLEDAGDDRLLAGALSHRSSLHAMSYRYHESIQFGERAIALARAVGDPAVLSHALASVGGARGQLGLPEARAMLEESLQLALSAGTAEDACRAYASLIWRLLEDLQLDEAGKYLEAAVELADGVEHLTFLNYVYAERALHGLTSGSWDRAVSDAELVVTEHPLTRCHALTVLGRVRVRRGQPGGERLLADAWEVAQRTRELRNIGSVAAARAEAAWFRGDHPAMAELLEPAYADACRLGAVALRAELGYWMAKAGQPVAPDDSGHPYALQAAGRWEEAAKVWLDAGCPYEHAVALAESIDLDDLLTALSTLDTLGAQPLARRVRVRLRELGVARIPRGPLAITRNNPAGLTHRQLQVARLLAEGLTNTEIAGRLVVSVRTVDNHVAAVFDKLGARTRRDIALSAAELGLSLDEE